MTDEMLEQAMISWLAPRGYLITKVDVVDVTVISPFDEWYDLYPRKVGPSDAQKAYNKALGRGASHSVLCEAVRAQTAPGGSLNKTGADKKFIPHPSRWLNDDRWKEEATARSDFNKPQIGGRTRSALDSFLEED